MIVIGGGHAGLEAAWAAAKFARVALLVGNPSTIGRMPCNPAVGGPGKSQLVFEVQALGGLMGRLADDTAIHTRVLNASKGPAVQSLRVQNERDAYAEHAQDVIFGHTEIDVIRGEAADLESDGHGGWLVVTTDGRASGLPQRGGCGRNLYAGGDVVRPAVAPRGTAGRATFPLPVRSRWNAQGIVLKRYKTGTPPRVRADAVRLCQTCWRFPPTPSPRGFTGHARPARHPLSHLADPHHPRNPPPDSRKPARIAHVRRRHRGIGAALLPQHRGQGGAVCPP